MLRSRIIFKRFRLWTNILMPFRRDFRADNYAWLMKKIRGRKSREILSLYCAVKCLECLYKLYVL
jgi:hypothetical protein